MVGDAVTLLAATITKLECDGQDRSPTLEPLYNPVPRGLVQEWTENQEALAKSSILPQIVVPRLSYSRTGRILKR
jgi:hypothetical protein